MARAGPSASLRLHFLGRFGLAQDDQPIQLPTRKAESLLAYLALRPGERA
jgi:DNA-binding SARP family transcriptional activator